MTKKQIRYYPDFKKLKIVFKEKIRNNWVGDWNLKNNTIMISNKLNKTDTFFVVMHEFTEMMMSTIFGIPDCCSKEYKEGFHGLSNLAAHTIANNIERKILEHGKFSWVAHEERIKKLKAVLKNG